MKPAFENTVAHLNTVLVLSSPRRKKVAASAIIIKWAASETANAIESAYIFAGSKGRWKTSMTRHGVTIIRRMFIRPETDEPLRSFVLRQTNPTPMRAKSIATCVATVTRFSIFQVIVLL